LEDSKPWFLYTENQNQRVCVYSCWYHSDSIFFDQEILGIVGKAAEPANIHGGQLSLDVVFENKF